MEDSDKFYMLIFIFTLVLTGYVISFFLPYISAKWIVITILVTLLSFISQLTVLFIIKYNLFLHYIDQNVKKLKKYPSFKIVATLIKNQKKYPVYVLYMPSKNTVEVCFNIFNVNLISGNKVYVKTLTNRYVHIIPKYLSTPLTMDDDFICLLNDFYNFNEETKSLLENYLLKIRDNVNEPWILHTLKDVNDIRSESIK